MVDIWHSENFRRKKKKFNFSLTKLLNAEKPMNRTMWVLKWSLPSPNVRTWKNFLSSNLSYSMHQPDWIIQRFYRHQIHSLKIRIKIKLNRNSPYIPASLFCAHLICSVHSLKSRWKAVWKRWSVVYVYVPTVKMWISLWKIQKCSKKNCNINKNISNRKSCRHTCVGSTRPAKNCLTIRNYY